VPVHDVDLVNACMDEGNEVLLLGPVPEGGRFVMAKDRGGNLQLWWLYDDSGKAGKRRRVPPVVAPSLAP
jgi:hypothetical protein